MADIARSRSFRTRLGSIVALALCVFLWPAVLTFDVGDWPSPHRYPNHLPSLNACGQVGAWLSYQLHYYLGGGTYPALFFATVAVFLRLARGRISSPVERVFGVVLLTAGTAASAHLIWTPSAATLPTGHGGVLGYVSARNCNAP